MAREKKFIFGGNSIDENGMACNGRNNSQRGCVMKTVPLLMRSVEHSGDDGGGVQGDKGVVVHRNMDGLSTWKEGYSDCVRDSNILVPRAS